MSYNCQASYLWYAAFTKFKVASTATGCPLENLITFFSTCSKEADPNDIGALRSLVIHKIPKDTNGEQIRKFFQDYGASTKVVVNKRIHQAFVTFSIFEVHQVLMAKDELRNRGKCAHFKYPPWRCESSRSFAFTVKDCLLVVMLCCLNGVMHCQWKSHLAVLSDA